MHVRMTKATKVNSRMSGLITLLLVFIGVWTLAGCGNSTAKAPSRDASQEVTVVEVKPQRIAINTDLPGRTSAFLIAEVRPQVGGIIQNRFFTEGSDVKAGDVLYQIDPATYQAAYDSANAALARAEANITSIRFRAERYKELVEIKAVSRQEYDDATAALKQAEAEIAASKAAVETARINLGYTRVTAPIAGRIGKSSVTVGALSPQAKGCRWLPFSRLIPSMLMLLSRVRACCGCSKAWLAERSSVTAQVVQKSSSSWKTVLHTHKKGHSSFRT